MIPPSALKNIIRHFDAVDRALSRRMHRNRPWFETALTSLLCDMLDPTTQDDERLDYTLIDLNNDLATGDGLLKVSFQIETHEYGPTLERYVTQSDLGFVLNFRDELVPEHSWSLSWLLQAKRMTPTHGNPEQYNENSRFGGIDSDQSDRMRRLMDAVGIPFIHYLLYCPRPCFLGELPRKKLAHLRNANLTNNIFDYTLGLILHDELGRAESSLAAGVFVADIDNLPKNLGAVHSQMLQTSFPFSWFIASHLVVRDNFGLFRQRDPRPVLRPRRPKSRSQTPSSPEEWSHDIVTGNPAAIDRLISVTKEINDGPFPILPPHTLTVDIAVGDDLNPEFRRIRAQ